LTRQKGELLENLFFLVPRNIGLKSARAFSSRINSDLGKTEIAKNAYRFYGDCLPSVTISDELHQEIKNAVKEGACCSVNHYVERTLKASLKKK
jgi:hypothetical protein